MGNAIFTTFNMLMFAYLIGYTMYVTYTKDRTIKQQQETINRLINREPVTYAVVGTTPKRPSKERYAAWGNEMVDLDEDEKQ